MGAPADVRQVSLMAGGETLSAVVLSMGNPQCVVLGPLPDEERFRRLGAALEHHSRFPDGTNVEFAVVESPGARADSDLGTRVRSDALVGNGFVRGGGGGGGLRRRVARRRDCRAGRTATRRMARGQRLPHRLGGSRLRRGLAARIPQDAVEYRRHE